MQTPDNSELAENLVAHILAYRFLGGAFFNAPELELLTTITTDNLFADWPLESSNSTMQEGLAALQRFSASWREADFQDLKRDYARLFVGPDSLPTPPWESVYRSKEHLLFEEETFQVRAMYRQCGFAVPGDYVQPEDHFGLEMLFVAHQCQRALAALNNGQANRVTRSLDALGAFFAEHICQWSDQFLADVQTNAETPYYQGLAQLAAGCIAHTVTRWQINIEDTAQA